MKASVLVSVFLACAPLCVWTMRRTAGETNIRQAELRWPFTPPSAVCKRNGKCREEKNGASVFCASSAPLSDSALKTGRRQQHKSSANGMLLFVRP